jgi:hypothetical protein
VKIVVGIGALLICAGAAASELHPIVEIESGYLFGATADGKWIKADEAAKTLPDENDVSSLWIDPTARRSQREQTESY